MLHGNNVRTLVGKSLPFELEKRKSFAVRCPKCSDERTKAHARSLMVYRDDDKFIRFRCHHADSCEWNEWQRVPDPSPGDVEGVEVSEAIYPIPSEEHIPEDYNGDKLYWYRDIEGRYLFANRRIQLSSGKLYVPFIYTYRGFVTGREAKWPKEFKGLYGAHTLKGKSKVIVVEGEKAADAAMAIFPNHGVVSWLGGANSTDKADWSLLKDAESVLLWPDNDGPGIKVMQNIAHRLGNKSVLIAKVTHLDKGADLADSLTAEQIVTAVKSAVDVSSKLIGVWSLEEIENQLEALTPNRKSGYDILDAHTPLPGSGLLVIEGRTKHGKSALAVALTSKMLISNLEKTVTYYSYEMTAAKLYLRYMKTLNTSLTQDNYRNSDEAKVIGDLITSKRLQIIDQSAQLSITDIVIAAGKAQAQGSVVVLDYLQIVPAATSYGRSSRQVLIKEMLDELRVAAHKNNVLVLVLSQLTPDYINPINDAPREAKDIHYSADMVIRVWNKAVGDSHPKHNSLSGDYVVHTYLNRDGESNVVYSGSLEAGSKLSIKNRVKEK